MIDRRRRQIRVFEDGGRRTRRRRAKGSRKWRAVVWLAGLLLYGSAAFAARAQTPSTQEPTAERSAAAASEAKASREGPAPHFSKFEARHIRHICYGRANERGLKGSERAAFLSHCYFGRVSHRAARHACRKEGAAKGLDNAALHDYVRECVRERSRTKDQKD